MDTYICAYCETALDEDEGSSPSEIGNLIVCDDCYQEHAQYVCCVCEDYEENAHQHTYLVVTMPAEVGLRLPGLY